MVAVNYHWNPINDNIVREFGDGGAIVAEYTTEPDLYGNVVSQYRNGQTSYLLSDGQGSTTDLTNDAGTVTDTIRYSAFGEVMQRTGTTEIPFQYLGRKAYYRDAGTAAYSVRRRSLQSRQGSWSSQDPIGEAEQFSVYCYVKNAPLKLDDPSGLFFFYPDPRLNKPITLKTVCCTFDSSGTIWSEDVAGNAEISAAEICRQRGRWLGGLWNWRVIAARDGSCNVVPPSDQCADWRHAGDWLDCISCCLKETDPGVVIERYIFEGPGDLGYQCHCTHAGAQAALAAPAHRKVIYNEPRGLRGLMNRQREYETVMRCVSKSQPIGCLKRYGSKAVTLLVIVEGLYAWGRIAWCGKECGADEVTSDEWPGYEIAPGVYSNLPDPPICPTDVQLPVQ
jgi:RHS repeat-associated protein